MRIYVSLFCLITIFSFAPSSSPAAVNRCIVKETRAEILVLECQGGNENFQEGTQVKIKSDSKGSARIKR